MENSIIANHFQLLSPIGSGSFGQIWKAVNLKTKLEVAVKIESSQTSAKRQVNNERKIYIWLNTNKRGQQLGIPKIYYHGPGIDENQTVMVMDLLGSSLEELFNQSNRKFTLKTVLMLADQMIRLIEYVHKMKILHRDIKPENFTVGIANLSKIHVIDFGLAKKYLKSDGTHIPFKEGRNLIGTARYASINAHLGYEQSRRDDMEALGYVFVYFMRGSLPWQNLKAVDQREKYTKIKDKKITIELSKLCKGMPHEFTEYFEYCRSLEFEDEPDYNQLRKNFDNLFQNLGYKRDGRFDWIKTKKMIKRRDLNQLRIK